MKVYVVHEPATAPGYGVVWCVCKTKELAEKLNKEECGGVADVEEFELRGEEK